MNKSCRLFSAVLLTALICLPFAPPAFGLGADSIIDTIQRSFSCFVMITSENFALYQSQEQLVGDARTKSIVSVRPLHIAKYARQGAGVLLDAKGIIVTNAHTVENAGKVKVTLRNKTELPAEVVMVIPEDDLAFIKVTTSLPLRGMALAEQSSIQLGATVYNVGASEILRGSITEGKITGIGSKEKDTVDLFKINFDVYRGDSGGPVISGDGKIVGLIVAGSTTGGRLSIAIPANKIKKRYQQYLEANP
ncbi:MAG TPA: S1C family serine protease [Patescibacteria group bacterium]|nr:S1C family serine protease [Patescibacteria group bacterium]